MELKDTIKMMTSDHYIDRFKAEYWQVKIRYEKLRILIAKYKADKLDFDLAKSFELLEDQLYYMNEYLKVLEVRAELEEIDLRDVAHE